MVTFTLIRHGESTDNLIPIWAGWKDAPLSNHGMNQAIALGASFSRTNFTAIVSSTLKRALMTAEAIRDAQSTATKLSIVTSDLLREQNYGIAQGKRVTKNRQPGLSFEQHVSRGIFPFPHGRIEKFPEGESAEDLRRRAEKAIELIVLPYVLDARKTRAGDVNVAITSHGLMINEMIAALLNMHSGQNKQDPSDYRGLHNTGWTRLTISIKDARSGENYETTNDGNPLLLVHVEDFNRHEHLDNVVRQKGGIGSATYDPKQKDIRDFFGGSARPDT